MTSLEINGTTLLVEERGRGEPLVFVHGDLSDARVWRNQLEHFEARYRTVAYSRRYHYPNTGIPDGVDNRMEVHVDDLDALLDRLQIDRAHLVGDSWGAFIALLFTIQHPDRVRTLVLAEPPVIPLLGVSTPPRPSEVLRLLTLRFRAGLAFLRFAATVFVPASLEFQQGNTEKGTRRFARGVLGPRVYDRLPESRLEQARDNAKPLAAALLGAGFPPLSEADVRGVSAPVLLVAGAHTRAIFRMLIAQLGRLLSNSSTAIIPAASHSAHETNPEFYNTTVQKFLARNAR